MTVHSTRRGPPVRRDRRSRVLASTITPFTFVSPILAGARALGPTGDAVLVASLGEQIAIKGVIAGLREKLLAPIAAVAWRDGDAGDADAEETGHDPAKHRASWSFGISSEIVGVVKPGPYRTRRAPGIQNNACAVIQLNSSAKAKVVANFMLAGTG